MIHPAPNAPDGSVETLTSYSPSVFTPTSSVLCRNTAPLLALAMALLRRHVACRVLGKDIGAGLLRTVDKLGTGTISEFRDRLDRYCTSEAKRAKTKQAREALEDRCDALRAMSQDCISVDALRAVITRLFADTKVPVLTLSTVHKAKGLEWPTVFILDWHLVPSKWAEADWEMAQERNLQYVAVTRAKLDLRFIRSEGLK
jgi:hypothetical protein